MKKDIANIKKKTIDKKVNIKFYYPYEVEVFNEVYELKLVYNENDGTLDGIVYEKSIHRILTEVLNNFSDYSIPLNVTDYRKRIPETRYLKVMFNKAGGNASKNAISNKMSLPTRWVSEIGFSKNDRVAKVTYDGNKIIIEKK